MSFRLKTILGIALIEGMLLLILVAMGMSVFHETLDEELSKRTVTTANVFTSTVKDAVIASDLATLESFSQSVISNPDIVYVRVLDDLGVTLMSAGDKQVLAREFKEDVDVDSSFSDGVYDISAPIKEAGSNFGSVQLGMSSQKLHEVIEQSRNNAVGIAFIEMALVALFSFMLGTYLTRQLTALKEGADKIERGELGYMLEVKSRDEIGQLAESFNTMSGRVKALYDAEREQVEYTRGIVDNVLEGIVTITAEGIITDINPEMKNIFGYDEDELIGTNVKILVPNGKARIMHDSYLRHAAAESGTIIGGKRELIALHKDGTHFPIELSVKRVRDVGGGMLFLGVVTDISKHKNSEDQLRKAMEEAKVANKAKSEFLASMSHEIRTPMNGVLGMMHLLSNTSLDEKQKRYLDTAVGSGEMLLVVINDILDFSKLEDNKLELESIPFDLVSLAEETMALLSSNAHIKGLEVICQLGPTLPHMVVGDPTRLRQILINLIGNAIKFTDSGEVCLSIKSGDTGILFAVSDTGIGMTDEQRKNIFTAFTKADNSTTRKYGGTGLGLAIGYSLVQGMSGELAVDSESGAGTTFHFELPLEVIDTEKNGIVSPLKLQLQRILLVDDNATNQIVIKSHLEDWGIKSVDIASSAEEALGLLSEAAYNQCAYDTAILDMCMPGMDGMELASCIRDDSALQHMKLVMLSSVDRVGFAKKDTDRLNAWLNKPARQQDLYNTLLMMVGEGVSTNSHDETSEQQWQFDGYHILLVEDNLVNQEVAKEILSNTGLTVDIMENGALAVQAVLQKDYDAVLMDIQMPVMDGFEATQTIRALGGKYADLPIIAMTAHALTGDSDKSLEAGMNAHVTKPINTETVFKTLSKWLSAAAQQNEQPVAADAGEHQADDDELPGIDIDSALARLGCPRDIFENILTTFHEGQSGVVSKISDALASSDFKQARALAHTLKGSSANLSAEHLSQAASDMEQACLEQDIELATSRLPKLQAAMDEVKSGIISLQQRKAG